MAVTPAVMPDLSGAYRNIQDALRTGASIQQNNTGGMGAAAAVVAPIAQEAKDRRDLMFQATLKDHLEQNKIAYAAQAEGKHLRTQDDYMELAKEAGVDPDKVKSLVPKEGVWTTLDQENDLIGTLKRGQVGEQMASTFDAQGNKTKANLTRLLMRSKDPQADQWLARLSGVSKPIMKIDPATKVMHIYDELSGSDLGPVPGVNTPDSAAGTPIFKDLPGLRKVDGKQADALETAGKSAASDSQLKSTAKDLDDLAQLKTLLNSKNPTATINIRADLARDIGGVPGGRFSSILSSSEGSDPSIKAQVGNYFSQKFTGQMSDQIRKELSDQIDTTVTGRKAQLAQNLNEKHQQAKVDAPYASDDLIAMKLGYQRYLSSPTAEKQAPEIKSKADYDKLQSGDQYVWNGQTLTKK